MSLTLDLGTKPEGTVAVMVTSGTLLLGDLEISMQDFHQLVLYVMTVEDILPNDYREKLLSDMKELKKIRGWNESGQRFGFCEG